MINLPQDHYVDIEILERLLDYSNLTTSYKIFWFYGIYKEIICGNQRIPFRRIVCRMISSAWYPLLEYHLHFGVSDKLNTIVTLIHEKYSVRSDINEEELLAFLAEIEDKEIEDKINNFYKYVPYRLIAPFFSDQLVGKKDAEKNPLILHLSQSTSKALYQIIMPEKVLYINNKWFDYIYRNQNIVEGWLNYKMIYYLQKKNPNVPAIPFKLSPPQTRDLNKARKYWRKVLKYIHIHDIYTNKPLIHENFQRYGEFSIDHFIPWSFVLHDELWNLVPTFKNINSSKSDNLPDLETYIDRFCDIQYEAFATIRKMKSSKVFLEDYLTINKNFDLNYLKDANNKITKSEFTNSMKSTIEPLFQIAYNQGYSLWHNKL